GPALLEGGAVLAGGRPATLDLLLGPLVELGLARHLGLGDAVLVGGGLVLGLLLAALGLLLLLVLVRGQEVVQGVAGLLGLLRGGRRGAQLLLEVRDLLLLGGLPQLQVGLEAGQLDQPVRLLLGRLLLRQGLALGGDLGEVGIGLGQLLLLPRQAGPQLGAFRGAGIGRGVVASGLGRAAAGGEQARERKQRENFHGRLQGILL